MDSTVWVALIGCFGVSLGAILTFIVQMKKLRSEQREKSDAQTATLNKAIKDNIDSNRNEYLQGISEVKKSIGDMNLCFVNLQNAYQSQTSLIDLRLQHLVDEFADMKTEVREHNNFAKRLPVLEEKMSVANHRISDLERRDTDDGK